MGEVVGLGESPRTGRTVGLPGVTRARRFPSEAASVERPSSDYLSMNKLLLHITNAIITLNTCNQKAY